MYDIYLLHHFLISLDEQQSIMGHIDLLLLCKMIVYTKLA